MNGYKKIIKSRSTRLKLLRLLSFVPDRTMLKLQYRIKTGRTLNLENPRRYTEKLQWYKLYYRDPLMRQCADKNEVREYVRDCGFGHILVDSLGVYNRVEDIPWNDLPDQFVLKDTLGGGGTAVILCRDKKSLDRQWAERQMQSWLDSPSDAKGGGREWVYQGKHRIYIEKLLPSDENKGGLIDYKFFCFNGEPEYIYVVADRKVGHGGGFGVFSAAYEKLDVVRCDERPLEREVLKPQNYAEMLDVAERLAKPFPHARIDLYDVEGRIYFGEITFFDGSGYMMFDPDSFDFELGEKFILPAKYARGGYNESLIVLVYARCGLQSDLEAAA